MEDGGRPAIIVADNISWHGARPLWQVAHPPGPCGFPIQLRPIRSVASWGGLVWMTAKIFSKTLISVTERPRQGSTSNSSQLVRQLLVIVVVHFKKSSWPPPPPFSKPNAEIVTVLFRKVGRAWKLCKQGTPRPYFLNAQLESLADGTIWLGKHSRRGPERPEEANNKVPLFGFSCDRDQAHEKWLFCYQMAWYTFLRSFWVKRHQYRRILCGHWGVIARWSFSVCPLHRSATIGLNASQSHSWNTHHCCGKVSGPC